MVIMTTYALNDIPFQDVYLQGLVQDDKGQKMSKSKGNVINPLDMADRYGADATRLSLVIGATPGNDMRLSEEKIAGFRNLVNKLWNVSRYIKQSLEASPVKGDEIDETKLTLADRWIMAEMNRLIKETTEHLDDYRFSEAGENLREFTWNILADWYIEASKFQKGEESGKVLTLTLKNLLKLWHPYIPFVTEKIWSEFGHQNLIVEKWPLAKETVAKETGQEFAVLKDIVSAIRNARSENKIEPSRKIKALFYTNQASLIKDNEALIKSLRTGIGEIEVRPSGDKPDKAIFLPVGNIEIYLIGAIDEAKEKNRLLESIQKLDALMQAIDKKLANQEFVSNAPEAIVAKEKEKHADLLSKKHKLEEQLKSLD
jgi:valyl-tRNA synthetase